MARRDDGRRAAGQRLGVRAAVSRRATRMPVGAAPIRVAALAFVGSLICGGADFAEADCDDDKCCDDDGKECLFDKSWQRGRYTGCADIPKGGYCYTEDGWRKCDKNCKVSTVGVDPYPGRSPPSPPPSSADNLCTASGVMTGSVTIEVCATSTADTCEVYMKKSKEMEIATCRQYCTAYGMACKAQYEDNNSCRRGYTYANCDIEDDTSDHICECGKASATTTTSTSTSTTTSTRTTTSTTTSESAAASTAADKRATQADGGQAKTPSSTTGGFTTQGSRAITTNSNNKKRKKKGGKTTPAAAGDQDKDDARAATRNRTNASSFGDGLGGNVTTPASELVVPATSTSNTGGSLGGGGGAEGGSSADGDGGGSGGGDVGVIVALFITFLVLFGAGVAAALYYLKKVAPGDGHTGSLDKRSSIGAFFTNPAYVTHGSAADEEAGARPTEDDVYEPVATDDAGGEPAVPINAQEIYDADHYLVPSANITNAYEYGSAFEADEV